MRRIFILLNIVLLGILSWPAQASCPGTTGCKLVTGCPAGGRLLRPGSPANSAAFIQTAINAATNGAVLCVPRGTFTGKIDFKGKAITLVSVGGPNGTTLNGGGTGPVVTFKTKEGPGSVLDGFKIENGKATYGGGIFISNASPVIRNCIVSRNEATGDPFSRGGGVSVTGESAKPAITCTQFLANKASYAGGGLISTYFADPYLRFNHFDGNTASYGGAIGAHWNGRLDVAKTCFQANQAIDGGGIHAGTPYGNVLVRQSCFRGNRASSHGGGMWVPAGLAQVVNVTFLGNQAADGGGLAAGFGGMVSVASSLFVRNTTSGGGSSALVGTLTGNNTSVVNHYNGFGGNTGGDFLNTYGDLHPLTLNPAPDTCCPAAGSPAINAGIPDFHFNDVDTSRNDMGACGGMKLF